LILDLHTRDADANVAPPEMSRRTLDSPTTRQ